MLAKYEKQLEREIAPLEESTKKRIFEKIKEMSNVKEEYIIFLHFQKHFV